MSQTEKAPIRVRNNVPRVLGLAGQAVVLQPGETKSVPWTTWQEVMQHPLIPKLLHEKLIAVVKGDKE